MGASLVLQALEATNPADLTYDEWLHVGMALHAEGFGVDVWDGWSANDPRYKGTRDLEEHWRTFDQGGNSKGRISGGTIVGIARDHGADVRGEGGARLAARAKGEHVKGDGESRDYRIAPRKNVALKHPRPDGERPADQLRAFLAACFRADDVVTVCPTMRAVEHYQCGELAFLLASGQNPAADLPHDADAGMWCVVNPTDGRGRKREHVAAYRSTLIECDPEGADGMTADQLEAEKARQLEQILGLNLPCRAIVDSGHKSVHAIVAIDADGEESYERRVRFVHEVCAANGFMADPADKNPNRLTRLAGAVRGERVQRLIATDEGCGSFDAWYRWVEASVKAQADADGEGGGGGEGFRLKIEHGGIADPPRRAGVMIDGILRDGHKMLVTAPGKSGKTILLTMLAVAAATGGEWAGRRVKQCDTLFIDPELDPPSFMNRVHNVAVAMGADLAEVDRRVAHVHLRGVAVGMRAFADQVCEQVERGRYGLVILDSVFKLYEGSENEASDVKTFLAHVDRITRATGAAFAMAHHTGKGPKGDFSSTERGRGSSVWGDDPDAPISLLEVFPPKDEPNPFGEGVRVFRLEADQLREFPGLPPTLLYLEYPVFRVDAEGLAAEWRPKSAQSKGGTASGESRAESAGLRRAGAEAALLHHMLTSGLDEITLKDAAETCGTTPGTVKHYAELSGLLEVRHPRANRCVIGVATDGGAAT